MNDHGQPRDVDAEETATFSSHPLSEGQVTFDHDELGELWQRLGVEAEGLRLDSDGTIAREVATAETIAGSISSRPTASFNILPNIRALPVLGTRGRKVSTTADKDDCPELEIGDRIGAGGMGEVCSALQVPLGREVAVKRLRLDRTESSSAADKLMREARIMGALEHPNIVPIHMLGRDSQDNHPLFVMKRIDGVPWSELIRSPEHQARQGDPRDLLEFNLDVFMDVCRAVHFAHSKGVIHRDVKPSNVMIGAFGEVYLLDWGLALALEDDMSGTLQLAEDTREIAGSPGYMAPEMAAGDGRLLTEKTDVYLLGAVLHECVTGKTRHRASSLAAVLAAAFESEPFNYDESVPAELAEICNRATSRDPDERLASAEAMRLAVDSFLRHRTSATLAHETRNRLRLLEAAIEAQQDTSKTSDDAEIEIQQLFSACRFGFGQALATWPENPAARDGLHRALETMIHYHLRHRDHRAASVLLGEFDDPPTKLLEATRKLEAELLQERSRVEHLENLERELDPEVGRGARAVFSIAIAVLAAIVPIVAGILDRLGIIHVTLLMVFADAALVGLGIEITQRSLSDLQATEVNRRVANAMRVFTLVMIVTPLVAMIMGLGVSQAMTFILLASTLFVGQLATTLDRLLLWDTAIFFLGCVASAVFQPFAVEIFGYTVIGVSLHSALSWKPPEQADAGVSDED